MPDVNGTRCFEFNVVATANIKILALTAAEARAVNWRGIGALARTWC